MLESQSSGPLVETSSGHPLVKAGVVVGALTLAVLVVMSIASAVIGFIWTVIQIALLVAVVAGIVHLVRRHR